MNKNEIIEILKDWSGWTKPLETGIPRPDYLARIKGLVETNHVLTITGPRRAGKSFLMRQVARMLSEEGRDPSRILMVNLEDPRWPALDVKGLARIFDSYVEERRPTAPPYVLLDEVQQVSGWERWVRWVQELGKARVVVSGSNATLLSRELGTLLTGRHLDVTVFPLSLGEFLAFHGMEGPWPVERMGSDQQLAVRGLLRRYLEFGAFPEVGLSRHPHDILLHYVDDLVHKDVVQRFRVRRREALHAVVRWYLSHTASLSTFTSLGKSLQVSSSTTEKFSAYLEQVYLVYFLKRFSFKVKEQEKSPRKVYAIDTGLSHVVGFRFSENLGRLAETAVALELRRQQAFQPGRELYYWKDVQHREVDFVIKDGPAITQLIQVCWRLDEPGVKEREFRSLLKAMEELEPHEALVVTDEEEGEETLKGRRIRLVPLWKWLLGADREGGRSDARQVPGAEGHRS